MEDKILEKEELVIDDQPAFADNIEEEAETAPFESNEEEAAEEESSDTDEMADEAEEDVTSEFKINLNINLSDGPIDREDGAGIGTKLLSQNIGYRGRFTVRHNDHFIARATGDTVFILSKPQISFGKHFGVAVPGVFLVTGEKLIEADLKKNDIIAFDATIAESENVNEKTGKHFITLTDIDNIFIVRRAE